MLAKVFINFGRPDHNWDLWKPVIGTLATHGHEVKGKPEEADISLVLSGKLENPLCFSGKRILVFHPPEWEPHPWGAQLFGTILQGYYHGYINVGNTRDPGEIVGFILDYIEKACNGDKERASS